MTRGEIIFGWATAYIVGALLVGAVLWGVAAFVKHGWGRYEPQCVNGLVVKRRVYDSRGYVETTPTDIPCEPLP
jgi:hypothetical protein